MAITKATSSVLATDAALNNLNAGDSIALTKPVSVSGNLTVDTNTLFVNAANDKVGIGTSSSLIGKLDVAGSPTTTTTTDVLVLSRPYNPGVGFHTAASFKLSNPNSNVNNTRLDIALLQGNASSPITPDTTVMTLLGDGRVGIGTTSPSTPLHVLGSLRVDNGSTAGALNFGADVNSVARSSNVRKLATIVSPDYANTRNIEWATSDSSSSLVNLVSIGGRVGGSNYAATSITLVTAPNVTTTGGTAALHIDSSQRVGIGTTSPNERLTVSGNISATGTLIASNYNPAINVAEFLADPTSAKLAAAVVNSKTGSDALVFGTAPTISSPIINNAITLNATTYNYGTDAASAHRTALSINNVDNTSDANKPVSTATQTAINDAKKFAVAMAIALG